MHGGGSWRLKHLEYIQKEVFVFRKTNENKKTGTGENNTSNRLNSHKTLPELGLKCGPQRWEVSGQTTTPPINPFLCYFNFIFVITLEPIFHIMWSIPHNLPIIQKTVEPAEARNNNGRQRRAIRPYCSITLNSRPTKFHKWSGIMKRCKVQDSKAQCGVMWSSLV